MSTLLSNTDKLKVGMAIAMLICLFDMPYGYYQIVRLGSAISLIYLSIREMRELLIWVFLGLAILFQPVFPIALNRQTWNIVDIISALLLLLLVLENILYQKGEVTSRNIQTVIKFIVTKLYKTIWFIISYLFSEIISIPKYLLNWIKENILYISFFLLLLLFYFYFMFILPLINKHKEFYSVKIPSIYIDLHNIKTQCYNDSIHLKADVFFVNRETKHVIDSAMKNIIINNVKNEDKLFLNFHKANGNLISKFKVNINKICRKKPYYESFEYLQSFKFSKALCDSFNSISFEYLGPEIDLGKVILDKYLVPNKN